MTAELSGVRRRPRFHPMDEKRLGRTPDGLEVRKFHKRPVYLPARGEGEGLVPGTQFTQRQIDELAVYERIRRDRGLKLEDYSSSNYPQRLAVLDLFLE